ncbi:replication initiation and membrane attachment family protein [Marinococcus luteus]|uniref:replication initiation and membrane attachment family protein n=1 Tax=Marinococcus luteus TaxID=1122204 RepID=UPI002ACC4888|nr:DnaD domain protein [Marinococcus luteus]MDZ5783773.1 DnaD domain protein [Marinococcus luteus]
MSLHWMEVKPVDGYYVRTSKEFSESTDKTMSMLYQPLVGSKAIALYQTLQNKLEKDCYESSEATHHELMAFLQMPLNEIYAARRLLEGIGLLRVYELETHSQDKTFVYDIQPPMSPRAFFQDDVLSVFLYNRLGKSKYIQLRQRFGISAVPEGAEEITASFNEVFASLHASEMASEPPPADEGTEFVGGSEPSRLQLEENGFDMELLKASLPSFLDSSRLLTPSLQQTVRRLAFVYQLSPIDMGKVIQESLSADDEVNIEDLRNKAKNHYRMEHGAAPPALGNRTEREEPAPAKGRPVSEQEQMKQFYEQTSPVTFLRSVAEGATVPESDIHLVEELLFSYRLSPGVVNVLTDYVMKKNNMKLSKALVYKIAGQWTRKKVHTVEDAMKLAKEEHKQAQERQAPKNNYTNKRSQGYVRNDKLPKWLEKEEQAENTPAEGENSTQEKQLSKERERFEEMLKERRERANR